MRVTELQPQVGSTANSYVILAKLATGGMAELFLARNESGAGVERYVVLKRVLSHRANDASFVNMFLDEARLAAQLQHPNIAQVYDTGVLGDAYFFTMEYVHGETVREVMHRGYDERLAIPIGCALTIAAGAAAGLHHAHERIGVDGRPLGIVHRDVSPSNVMVSYEGHVKIVDFGVAKAARRSSETQSGTVKGKIAYLSPEQCRGRVVDRRSDLFSLGIVLWEMIAGDRLFKHETDYEIMDAIIKEPAPLLSSVRDDVPPAVDALVLRLLAKDPAERFQSGDALLEAIEEASVAVGAPLSTAALGRFMRELFGNRPEPWVQVQDKDTHEDTVTVTASPFVAFPVGPNTTSAQLAAVPDLGLDRARGWPDASPGPGGPVKMLAGTSSKARVAYAPHATDDDHPTTAKGRILVERQRPRRRLALGIATVLLLGAAGTAGVIAYGDRDRGASAAADQNVAGSAAAQVASVAGSAEPGSAAAQIAPAVGLDAGAAEPAPGSDHVASAEDGSGSAGAGSAVAGSAAGSGSAGGAEVVHGSGSAHTGTRPHVARVPHHEPAHHEPAHHEPVAAHEAPGDALQHAIQTEQYGDALALCVANGRLASQNLVSCILSACHAHDADRAKRWIAAAPSARREDFVAACRAAGTSVEPAKPRAPDCDVDPMACRQ